MTNTWNYPSEVVSGMDGRDLDGYEVEASDGGIGKIDEHHSEPDAGYVIVDTGFWIFGKKRIIPAGVIRSVDHGERKVHVAMSKDDIKAAPDLDEATRGAEDWHRSSSGNYYDPFAW